VGETSKDVSSDDCEDDAKLTTDGDESIGNAAYEGNGKGYVDGNDEKEVKYAGKDEGKLI
jgi:hypothetical protein